MRTHVPLAICVICGLVMLVQFFVPNQGMKQAQDLYLMWGRIIAAFALVLGIVSLVRINVARIRRRVQGWPFSYVTIGGFVLMFSVGAFGGLFLRNPITLALAYEDGQVGTASLNQTRSALTFTRGEESYTLGPATPIDRATPETNAYVNEFVMDGDEEEAGAESQAESQAESVPAESEAAADAPPTPTAASVTIGAGGDGAFRLVLSDGSTEEAGFTWTTTGGERAFMAGADLERNRVLSWLFNYVQIPMDSTIFSLLAFYIASAAFRSFRARDITSTLLLSAAVIVMLGRAPITATLWTKFWGLFDLQLPSLGEITEWIMQYPNTAAKRAIYFGVALAALGQSLRILAGVERPYMAGTGE